MLGSSIMATRRLISEDEYLRSSFAGPEPDYIEGDLVERAVPNFFHGCTQVNLTDAFKPWQDKRRLFRATEIRLRLAPGKFRVADFAVFATWPHEAIPECVPLAVVEIVSPDDRYEEMMSKLADYEQAGVEFIFIADPPTRKLSRYRHGDLSTVGSLEIPAQGVAISLDSIFG